MSAYPNPALYCCLSDPGVDGIFSVTVTCVKFAGTVERGVFFFFFLLLLHGFCANLLPGSQGAETLTTTKGRDVRGTFLFRQC